MAEGISHVIAGRYRLVVRLGHGGMGVVWQARDELLGRDVAVKEIRVSVRDDAVDLLARRALREARAAARLRHPGIVMVHDIVTDEGRPWIVMELVRGRSLAQIIDVDGPLPAWRAAAVGRQVLDALGAAHRRGILHRDVKPANILLDGDRAVLTDFGIAAIDGATALTATGLLVGSPDYLAPERIDGHPPTTAVDMWGLGVTLYTAVAGHPPFHRDDIRSTLAAVLVSDPKPLASAPDLWPVVRGLLAKSPEARLTLAAAVPLLTAAMGMPPTAPPITTRSVARPTVPPAGSGPPVRDRSWARTITLVAVSAVVLLLPGELGWPAPRGPDDPGGSRAAVSVPAGAGSRTTSPSPSPTTPPAPAGFELARGSGWSIVVPSSLELVSSDLWSGKWSVKKSEESDDDVRVSVHVTYYARNDRMVADKELMGNEQGFKSDADYAAYKRLRLTRRLPATARAGSVAEIEYTRMKDPKSAGLVRPISLDVEAQGPEDVRGVGLQLVRGVVHWWGYSRSIDRAFVTKEGTGMCVVSVTVAADSSEGRRRSWPKEQTTFTTILNSFRFTSD